jgi:hypothetical protein
MGIVADCGQDMMVNMLVNGNPLLENRRGFP